MKMRSPWQIRFLPKCNDLRFCMCRTVLSPLLLSSKWLGADGNTLKYGRIYLQIVVLDMPLLYTINIFSAINQAQGDTVRPMLLNLLGILINMVLDPLLMVVLDLNIAGAALATLSAKLPSALIAFYSLNQKDKLVHLDLKHIHFEKTK